MIASVKWALESLLAFTFIAAEIGEADPPGFGVYVRTPTLASCNISQVRGLAPRRHLLVRAGPSQSDRVVGRISEGRGIYVCNEHAEWWGVIYGEVEGACEPRLDPPVYTPFAEACRAGWVHRNWVELITG